mgnify:CR=1 FL=1
MGKPSVGPGHGADCRAISPDAGRTWGNKYTLVENDGKCNVMEVNFLRLKSGGIALFHLQKNAEVGGTQTPDCGVVLRVSRDEGRTFGSRSFHSESARTDDDSKPAIPPAGSDTPPPATKRQKTKPAADNNTKADSCQL